MTPCPTCRAEYGHSPECAARKRIAELSAPPQVDGDTVLPALTASQIERAGRSLARCSWCNTDAIEAAARHEGPHSTWCVHYRRPPLPVLPPLMPEELYGRSGAEIVAEQLGYQPCPACGNRVVHLPGCAAGRGIV